MKVNFDLDTQEIVDAIDRQTLVLAAATLMSGWISDDTEEGRNRVTLAIHRARHLLHDARSTVESRVF